MTKIGHTELVREVSDQTELSRAEADRALKAVVDTIEKHVAKGDEVSLVGFGKFEKLHRKARKCRDIRSGKSIKIPAHDLPRFRAGAKFKKRCL